jgi:glyoxylase-like metal-dependent hydrolase (beta-lactamase superfamily II)
VAPNPGPMTLEGTNTWLVGRNPAWVIDPGPPDQGHIDKVRVAAESRGGLGGVLLTHSHGDHAGGVDLLGVKPTPAREGEAAGPFEVIATPGHAADHVCFLLDRVCFTGDLILGQGSSIVPPDGGSLSAYMDSLRKLQALDLDLLCPGHGPEVTDPRAKIAEYIEHREMRERKLVEALDAGERSRERLLDIAWDDVPPELRPAAAVAMETHLQKLAEEGRLPGGLAD